MLSDLGARVVDGSLATKRSRYHHEVVALIEAAHRVHRRRGEFTVAQVLEESGLGTRAFYRHFASKDELVLCMFEFDAEMFLSEIRRASDQDATPRERFERWVDWQIGIMVHPKRADRYALFDHELGRLKRQFPDRVDDILGRIREPLVEILEAGVRDGSFPGARPLEDAVVVRAIVNAFLQAPGHQGLGLDATEARATILRFCLPAIGAQ
jgi:AcrR family transcriptional regulator